MTNRYLALQTLSLVTSACRARIVAGMSYEDSVDVAMASLLDHAAFEHWTAVELSDELVDRLSDLGIDVDG